jgi:oligopeptidase A
MNQSMNNPLLNNYDLPEFSRIGPEHAEPAIDHVLAHNRRSLTALLDATADYTWDNLLHPLEEMDDRLRRAWSPVNHLHAVADNENLRQAYNRCLPKLTEYATEMGQNEKLYLAYRRIAESGAWTGFNEAQKKIIDNAIRDFRLYGVDLMDSDKALFKDLKRRLSELETKFEENLLDATQGWTMHIQSKASLRGLPDSAVALAAQNAQLAGKSGWLFTLDSPSYNPVMQYADARDVREAMYRAYVTRASDAGPCAGRWDNTEIMLEILSLRKQIAQLLGYGSYAEMSLVRRMARTTDEVIGFLNTLAARSRPVAEQEYGELAAFAASHGVSDLQAWDLAYYSELLRRDRYSFSAEELRPYFPLDRVMTGLFTLVKRLYGISVAQRPGVDVWHPDVRFYDLHDDTGELRGGFYLDPFSRMHKRGGAWMDECQVRKRYPGISRLPVAYLTCNFTPPVGTEPSLLTHDEVITLFHEFGHGLHHMLTRVDYPGVAGINGVLWDAIELPSQFMENWCWVNDVLALISGHYRTGAALPDGLLTQMRQAKNFQSGMQMVRQIEYALFDFHLHHDRDISDSGSIQRLLDDIRRRVAVVIPPSYNRFQHSFAHVFGGGYAAGYYGYKWAEVLSADAYSKFEETGMLSETTGRQFMKTILEQGGSKHPMDLFIEFRGREPAIDAMLRHSGILAGAAS